MDIKLFPVCEFSSITIVKGAQRVEEFENEKSKLKNKLDMELWRSRHPHRSWARSSIQSHKNREFDIRFSEDYLTAVAKKSTVCGYCNCELEWDAIDPGKPLANSPTVDRIYNDMYLDQSNIMICCWNCNVKKNRMPVDEFLEKIKTEKQTTRSIGSLIVDGETYRSLAEVARAYKINRKTLYKRIKAGWTLDRAIKQSTSKEKNAWETCAEVGCEHPVYFQGDGYCCFHWKQHHGLIDIKDREYYLSTKEREVVEKRNTTKDIIQKRDYYLKFFTPLAKRLAFKMARKYELHREDLYQEALLAIIVSTSLIDESKTRREKHSFVKRAIYWALFDAVSKTYDAVNYNAFVFFEAELTEDIYFADGFEFMDDLDPEQCLIDKEEMKRRMSDEELGMALLEEYRDNLSYRDLVIWDAMLTPNNYGNLKEIADVLGMTNRNLRYIKNKLVLKFSKHVRENTNEEVV